MDEIFGRITDTGDVDLFNPDGTSVTQLDAAVYPAGSDLSTRYEHPEGITITLDDCRRLSIVIEDE